MKQISESHATVSASPASFCLATVVVQLTVTASSFRALPQNTCRSVQSPSKRGDKTGILENILILESYKHHQGTNRQTVYLRNIHQDHSRLPT